ncbi:uncharacterized protein PGTG_09264 [Puccinia graminis f. sp. tritici CRL 75-36-700-3]|uniref:Uncharacterized protein n=1 Tax=Puccinia graminis f. sp. tritici (strain CRL 75-36-700-3 / race SCCL) TaxID=418459 RepID=E3KG52_PUCGT|nr:uncharacterized protein PGTG_09264 [Puccinia graminis f. sp. tritici CRL 75-36-700-3]EFP83311.2 hypothetical protein PGTG_09264 [Puccinia graminis f. sp. tritici CRL 75-36-700-3]
MIVSEYTNVRSPEAPSGSLPLHLVTRITNFLRLVTFITLLWRRENCQLLDNRSENSMKISNRHLGFLGLIVVCIALDELQGAEDLLSQWEAGRIGDGLTTPKVMDGSNSNTVASTAQAPIKETDFTPKLDTRPSSFHREGDVPNLTPSLLRGNRGEKLLRSNLREINRETERVMRLGTHIQTLSNRRRAEEIRIKVNPYSGSSNPPETLDLLKKLENNYKPPDPIANLDEMLRRAVFHDSTDLANHPTPGNSANLDEILRQAVRATQPNTTPVHIGDKRKFSSIDPGHPNQAMLRNFGNPIQSPVVHKVHPISGASASLEELLQQAVLSRSTTILPTPKSASLVKLDEILMQVVSSHGATQSHSTPVQRENESIALPNSGLADVHTEDQIQVPAVHERRTDKTPKKSSETVRESTSTPKKINTLSSQPSSSRNSQFYRLEFTHEVLGTSDPLSEDKMVIPEIRKLNPKGLDKINPKKVDTQNPEQVDNPNPNKNIEIVIYERNYKRALKIMKKCDSIMKLHTSIELKAKYSKKTPRRSYVEAYYSKLWQNSTAWIAFWNKRTSTIDFEKAIPQGPERLKKVFFLFLFYAEMIGTIFPKVEGKSLDENDSTFLETAIEIFRMIHNPNHDPKLKMSKDELLEYLIRTEGDEILGTLHDDNLTTLVWRCLKIWIAI